jgi:hypothetical protein
MEEVPGKALILGHAIAASGTLRRQAPRPDVHEPPHCVFFVIYLDILHEPFQVISQQLLREHTRGSTSSTVVWSHLAPGLSLSGQTLRCPSWRYSTLRLTLVRMQGAQRTCRFFSVFKPPRDKGIMWSSSRFCVAPQCWHWPSSRSKTYFLTSDDIRTRTMRVFGSIGIVLRAPEETQSPSLDNLIPS